MITKQLIREVEQVTGRFTGKVSGRNMVSNGIYGMIGKFGKTVFLARGEAEKSLKGMEENHE